MSYNLWLEPKSSSKATEFPKEKHDFVASIRWKDMSAITGLFYSRSINNGVKHNGISTC